MQDILTQERRTAKQNRTSALALYAAHQGLGLGGPRADGLFDDWVKDGLLWCTAFGCVGAALHVSHSRAAWLLVGLGLVSWAIGDTILSIRFGAAATPPATSVSDVFWLAWYPLVVAVLVLLVRERVPGFELHRNRQTDRTRLRSNARRAIDYEPSCRIR